MSTSSQQEDWRAQALRAMNEADCTEAEQELSRRQEQHWLGLVLVKVAALILLSIGLVWFGGFGWIFAVLLLAWFLFWPR